MLNHPSQQQLKQFYATVLANPALLMIDELVPLIVNSQLPPHQVLRIGHWLATEAPDREPVKTGITLIGLFQKPELADLIAFLGRHEEFTLFSSIALQRMLDEPDEHLWELAKDVGRWGRIQVVKRLQNTSNPTIKDWILREGYKNCVFNESLAYISATTGGLLDALRSNDPDDELLVSAGDILAALINAITWPDNSIFDYQDAPHATLRYAKQCKNRQLTIGQLISFIAIRSFVDSGKHEAKKIDNGWTSEICNEIFNISQSIIERKSWPMIITAAIEDNINIKGSIEFHIAAKAAKEMDIDIWKYYLHRHKKGVDSHWQEMMQTNNSDYISEVISLAEKTLPIDKIQKHNFSFLSQKQVNSIIEDINMLAQELRNFPGMGWNILKVSLRGPSQRGRYMTIHALRHWGRKNWPNDAIEVLMEAHRKESDFDIAWCIQELLSPPNDEADNPDYPENWLP